MPVPKSSSRTHELQRLSQQMLETVSVASTLFDEAVPLRAFPTSLLNDGFEFMMTSRMRVYVASSVAFFSRSFLSSLSR